MTIVRWEPLRELSSLQSEMNRLFASAFEPDSGGGSALRRWVPPPMDFKETGEHFLLRTDLPGLSEEDVNIELEDSVLTISGERRIEEASEGEGWQRVERTFGQFSRSLTLPQGIDAEAIQASFDRGVLELRIPKPEQRKPKKISIGATNGQAPIEGTSS